MSDLKSSILKEAKDSDPTSPVRRYIERVADADDMHAVIGILDDALARVEAGLVKHADALRLHAEKVTACATPGPPWCAICQGRAPRDESTGRIHTKADIQHTDDCPVTLARQATTTTTDEGSEVPETCQDVFASSVDDKGIMTAVPEMDAAIVGKLEASGEPHCRYAAVVIEALRQETKELHSLAELAWGLIANAYGGKASGWKDAAERWRDAYGDTLPLVGFGQNTNSELPALDLAETAAEAADKGN